MSSIDINRLNADELKRLKADAEEMLKNRRLLRAEELLKEVEALALELQISLYEILGLDDKQEETEEVTKRTRVKYRNRHNPKQVWSGRGPYPSWLTDALAKGGTLNDIFGLDAKMATMKKVTYGNKKIPIKYRNPDDPKQFWSGRGPYPIWLVNKLAKGEPLEKFKIGR